MYINRYNLIKYKFEKFKNGSFKQIADIGDLVGNIRVNKKLFGMIVEYQDQDYILEDPN